MERYFLKCLRCGKTYKDNYFRLRCDEKHEPALLRTYYRKGSIQIRNDLPGMYRYYDFLPVNRILDIEGGPVVYKSEALGNYLGLKNLYIIFNGYWPEKGAFLKTGSFKELEAPSVLGRLPENNGKTIVVASAGNTGRAFANICSENNIPLILVIPEKSKNEIWSTKPFNDCVKLVLASGNSDYYDAIELSNRIVELDGFFPEGGTFNVARRDGMSTTVLAAAFSMGRLPDHYFQAIGSGAGGIAAWEGFLRLRESGQFEGEKMRLHLSQNYPFIPMVEAWRKGKRFVNIQDEAKAKADIDVIKAKVLSNRKPPYGVIGGVFDVLNESGGNMYSVTNREIDEATKLFEEKEGVDIHPAAGVALGSLIQAVKEKAVKSEDFVALNITGGGLKLVERDFKRYYLETYFSFSPEDIYSEKIHVLIEEILSAVS